jgi:hypothetical protein
LVANELVSINGASTLTTEQYLQLADIPPELEWLANIANTKTRRFYKADVSEFISFTGLKWSARLEMCQWRRETLDKESIWDEGRSTSLSRW